MHFYEIEDVKHRVNESKEAYLRRFGWNRISKPSRPQLWRRDFTKSAVSNIRLRHRVTSYGVITLPTYLAVSMTLRVLDESAW